MAEQQSSKMSILALIIVAVLVLSAVVLWAIGSRTVKTDNSSQQPESQQNKPLTIEQREQMNPYKPADVAPGATLAQIGAAAKTWEPSLVNWLGKDAPDFALVDLQGNQHRLSDYKGKTVMVVFWATWCPPCKAEIPDLILLDKRMPPEDFKILAITNEDKKQVSRFVADARISYTILFDDGSMPQFYFGVQSQGIPSAVFVKPDGKIKFITTGLLPLEDTRAILNAEK
ncbi:MAG: TlpA disulfide reductase family protein [Phycisphaerae bacterium]|jgi:thiol-disulfide isomerase/thioredoxin